jgi:hypothetical protein
MVRKVWIAIALCAALTLPAEASDADSGGSFPSNVLLTITIREGNDVAEKTYRVVAQGDDTRTRLLTGWRVPIPTTTSRAEGDCGSETTYSYQNVGLTADVRAKVFPGNRVALRGEIEVSGAKESLRDKTGASRAPMIGTFEQSFHVLLDEGSPLELAAVANPDGGALSLRLQADILD